MFAMLLAVLSISTAQADPPELNLAQEPQGKGLGFAMGDSSGIALAYRPDTSSTVAGVVGWSLVHEQFHVHTDYQYNFAKITVDPRDDIVIWLSAGPGLSVDMGGSPAHVGLRAPLGFTLIPWARPFDVYVEIAPVLVVVPDPGFTVHGATGVRFYFP